MLKLGDKVYSTDHGGFCIIIEAKLYEGDIIYSVASVDTKDVWWSRSANLLADCPNKWKSPTLAEVESIVNNMPGGLDGFMVGWGWLQFAREVEKLCQEKNS